MTEMKQLYQYKSFSRFIKAILLFSALVLVGCLKEDWDDCPEGVSLQFSYTHNIQNKDLLSEDIPYITLQIFNDGTGEWSATYELLLSNLDDQGRYWLPLSKGKYHIVAWGSGEALENYYDISSGTYRDHFTLTVRNTENMGSLFYGSIRYEQEEYQVHNEEVSFIKNTNAVKVEILKTGDSGAWITLPQAYLKGRNASYNTGNEPGGDEMVYSPSYTQVSEGETHAEFTTLRLLQGSDVTINIGWGENIVRYDLVKEILTQHPDISTNEDLDRHDEYTLSFTLDETNNILELVKINNWEVNGQGGGI